MRLLAGRIGVSKGARGGIVVMVKSAWAEVVEGEVGLGTIVMEVSGGREGSLGCLIYKIKIKFHKTPPLVRKGVRGEDGKKRRLVFFRATEVCVMCGEKGERGV